MKKTHAILFFLFFIVFFTDEEGKARAQCLPFAGRCECRLFELMIASTNKAGAVGSTGPALALPTMSFVHGGPCSQFEGPTLPGGKQIFRVGNEELTTFVGVEVTMDYRLFSDNSAVDLGCSFQVFLRNPFLPFVGASFYFMFFLQLRVIIIT